VYVTVITDLSKLIVPHSLKTAFITRKSIQMKKFLLGIIPAVLCCCSTGKEVQMNMIDVELVKIDTVQRYPAESQKILTWHGFDNVDYVTFAPISNYYRVGSKMKVMVRK
jgi:hypothetical protein